MEEIKEKMINILRKNGIIIFDENEIIETDSLMYISIIVHIEEEFDIEVPDEYIIMGKLNNLSDFVTLISSMKVK